MDHDVAPDRPASAGGNRDAGAVSRRGGDLDELAAEVERGGIGHAHAGVSAGSQQLGGGEVHEAVLAGSAGERARISLRRSLDQHLFDATHSRLVAQASGALDHGSQPLHAPGCHIGGHEPVGQFCGFGAGARGEDERECAVESGRRSEFERVGEVAANIAPKTC